MNKIKPFNENDIIETKYSDNSSTDDHIINLKDIPQKVSKWFKIMAYFYDMSIDNIPMGAIVGLLITIFSSSFISYGIISCEEIINKYNSTLGNYITYHALGLSLFIIVHSCVLIHGISICILETSRECCQISEVGCFFGICKNKNSKIGKRCRVCQTITRTGIQIIWAIFGTILLLLLYLLSVSGVVFSSITTIISFILKNSCSLFSNNVNNLRFQANLYLQKAKYFHNYTDNAMISMLEQYNNWVNLKDSYLESGIGQVENITSSIYYHDPKTEFLIEKPHFKGRHLTEMFNPVSQISKGRSILETFNTSIHQTEMQLEYYNSQYVKVEEFCFDYASIYDNLYIISVGVICLLISQLIIFSVHYKYFSTWNYEMKLVKLNNYKITERKINL